MALQERTIGLTGRYYLDPHEWEADLDNATEYSAGDDAVGLLCADADFELPTALSVNGGTTLGLASTTLKPAAGHGHGGVAGAGARILPTSTGTAFAITSSGSISRYYDELEIDGRGLYCANIEQDGHKDYVVPWTRLMLHDHYTSGNANIVEAVYADRLQLYNFLIYNGHNASTTTGARITGVSAANHTYVLAYGGIIHNLTCEAGKEAVGSSGNSSDITRRNVIATDCATACFSSPDQYAAYGNISSDLTATGDLPLTNIAASDLYVSTVVGMEDFHLKTGSPAIDNGGDASAFYTDDIAGTARVLPYDSGAFEYVVVGGGTTVTPTVDSITVGGQPVSVVAATTLNIGMASTSITGQVVDIITGLTLQPGVSSTTIQGQSASITPETSFTVGTPNVTLVGGDVTTATDTIVQPASSTVSLVGQSIVIGLTRVILAALASITLTGQRLKRLVVRGDKSTDTTEGLIKPMIEKLIERIK